MKDSGALRRTEFPRGPGPRRKTEMPRAGRAVPAASASVIPFPPLSAARRAPSRAPVRTCGRRWEDEASARQSKRFLAGGCEIVRCPDGCGGVHVRPAQPAPAPAPGRAGRLRQVSPKRAALIRERRAMLQAKYPDVPLCEVPFCNQVADDAHEPLTRGRGGSITDPGNVRAICRPHHDEVTFEEPGWAYELGFLRHSWDGAPGGDAA